jgi:predicted PurR-regulated permease PerM
VPWLWQNAVALAKYLAQANTNADEWLQSTGFMSVASKIGIDASIITTKILPRVNAIFSSATGGLMGDAPVQKTNAGNLFTVLFFLILQPFLLFFFVRDYDRIGGFIRERVLPQNEKMDYARQISRILGSYLRGQFIVVLISMVNLSVGFWLFNVPYAFVLGIFSGLTNFIPTFGLWLSIFVCSVVAATLGDPWWTFLPGIYIVFAAEQVLETGFIVPRIIGKHVGLHPIAVMLSLLIFGFMFGFLGVLIAVPTAALASVFWEHYRETKELPFFQGAELESPEESVRKEK